MLLQSSGYKVVLRDKDDLKKISEYFGGHVDSTGKRITTIKDASQLKLHCHAYQVNFLNADSNAVAEPDKSLSTL